MREEIEFGAEGATLRGWFYRPDGASGEVACVVMAHGFSATKEMHLDDYADAPLLHGRVSAGRLVFPRRSC